MSSCSNDEFVSQVSDEDPSIEKIDLMLDDMIAVLANSVPIVDVSSYPLGGGGVIDSNANNFIVDFNQINDQQFNYAATNTLANANATASATAASTFELDLNVFDLMTTDSYFNLET